MGGLSRANCRSLVAYDQVIRPQNTICITRTRHELGTEAAKGNGMTWICSLRARTIGAQSYADVHLAHA